NAMQVLAQVGQSAFEATSGSESGLSLNASGQMEAAAANAGTVLQSGADAAAQALAAQGAPLPEVAVNTGMFYFIQQSDWVGQALFFILVLMSVTSWYLIIVKCIRNVLTRRRSDRFLAEFWGASSLDQVENEIATHGASEPFAHVTSHAIHARNHHVKYGALKLEEKGSTGAFVTRTIRKVIDEETAKLENGLTVLASVGSTAPFVGL